MAHQQMVGTLGIIALLWLAFNVVIGGIFVALSFARAVHRKRLIRKTSIDQLMAAHFDSVRRRSAA